MAEIKQENIGTIPVISQTEFAKEKGGITLTAITYLIDNGMIDYVIIGNRKYIVKTDLTKAYNPNKNSKREIKMGKKDIMHT